MLQKYEISDGELSVGRFDQFGNSNINRKLDKVYLIMGTLNDPD